MTKNLNILLYNNKKWVKPLAEFANQVHLSKDLKSLIRSLMEKDIDLIVFEKGQVDQKKIDKIFKSYQIPFLEVGGDIESHSTFPVSIEGFSTEIEKYSEKMETLKIARENKECLFILEGMRSFDIDVAHVSKDFFIAEVKNYLVKTIKAGSSFWVDVPESSSHAKLPPILRLKQELTQQKVDYSGVISDLDDCIQEVISEDAFQVWRHKQGKYIALLWLDVGTEKKQCVLVNGIQFSTKKQLNKLFHYLVPVLSRRWNICLAVGEAQEQVYKDSLTDLYNQKFLNETLDKKIEEYKRYKTPFSVLFIDVDHFKQVNDTNGHVVGSGTLAQMGEVLSEQIRNSDYAFRYGGDEFIILLSHTEGEDAINVAERIRVKIEATTFTVNECDVNVTVSIGLAFYPEHAQSAEEIVRIADEAMYYGKKKSRNIVYKAS